MAPWGKKHKMSKESITRYRQSGDSDSLEHGCKRFFTEVRFPQGLLTVTLLTLALLNEYSTLPTKNYSYDIKIWARPTEEHNVELSSLQPTLPTARNTHLVLVKYRVRARAHR
jgi:hypothetical protein